MPCHRSSSLSSSSIGFQRLIDRSHVELVEARHVLAQHLRTRGRRQFVHHFLKFLNVIADVIRMRKSEAQKNLSSPSSSTIAGRARSSGSPETQMLR